MSSGLKRIISSVILFPIVFAIFIFGNKYIIDIFTSMVAMRCMYELFHAFKQKGYHPVEPLGYIAAISICLLHIIQTEHILLLISSIIVITIVVSFGLIITKKTKTEVPDVAVTFFSVSYIVLFLMFIPIIRSNMENGVWLIWYIFISAWGTDTFAYEIGKHFGKHHFTDISPKKTVEGCIGGIVGSTICMIAYTIILNNFVGLDLSYIKIAICAILLSIISQIGDLSASTIKRYTGIKDFSNLIPGHGGMLDRIDSVIFVSPFIYFLLILI